MTHVASTLPGANQAQAEAEIRASGTGARWDRLPEEHAFGKKDITRNMACCIMMDAFFAFGFADMQVALQPLLVFLGASNTLFGFVNGMNLLIFFGLFASPFISRRLEYKKEYFFASNLPYLFPILVAGVATVVGANFGWSKGLLLNVLICSFVFHWVFGGFVTLPHTEYIAACIPATHRATMIGLSVSVGSGLGILSTAVGYVILDRVSKPAAYGWLFVLTWAITQSGYLIALFAKERRTPVERAPAAWSLAMLKAFWDDKRYVKFVALSCGYNVFLGVTAWNYINRFGLKDLGMLPKTAAIMAGVQLVARIATAGPMGAAIDKIGAKKIFPWLGAAGGLVLLPLIIAPHPMSVYVSIALSVVFFSAFAACCAVLQYGLPKAEHRSGHFTILVMAQVIAMSGGSIFIGWLADKIGFIPVFVVMSLSGFILAPVTWLLIKDFPAHAKDFH